MEVISGSIWIELNILDLYERFFLDDVVIRGNAWRVPTSNVGLVAE
jgi:hypothetical protein